MRNSYRLQLPPDGRFTEWRSFDEVPKEEYCLSIQFCADYDEDKAKEFMNKNFSVVKA